VILFMIGVTSPTQSTIPHRRLILVTWRLQMKPLVLQDRVKPRRSCLQRRRLGFQHKSHPNFDGTPASTITVHAQRQARHLWDRFGRAAEYARLFDQSGDLNVGEIDGVVNASDSAIMELTPTSAR